MKKGGKRRKNLKLLPILAVTEKKNKEKPTTLTMFQCILVLMGEML